MDLRPAACSPHGPSVAGHNDSTGPARKMYLNVPLFVGNF